MKNGAYRIYEATCVMYHVYACSHVRHLWNIYYESQKGIHENLNVYVEISMHVYIYNK